MARRRLPYWVCKRQQNGVKCLHRNPNRVQICQECRLPKPKRAQPKHMVALIYTYDQYVELNGGEHCGICGSRPKTRRLDRDHDHKTGAPRGLLCSIHNRWLPHWMTLELARGIVAYLERHEA